MSDSDTYKHTKPAEVSAPAGFFCCPKNIFIFFKKRLDFLVLMVYTLSIRNSNTTTIKNQSEVIKMTNVERATIIVNQLGGNKFTTMTGSKNFLALESGVRMDLAKNESGANKLEITLDGLDLYNMRFYKYTPGRLNKKTFVYTDDKLTEIQEYNGVYADQLQELFTGVTGFDTHL